MIFTGIALLITGGLLAGSGVLVGTRLASGGSDAISNSTNIKHTIINSLSNIELDTGEASSNLFVAIVVITTFVAVAFLLFSCCPHALGFIKARNQHQEKIQKLQKLQALLEQQIEENRQLASSVQSLFTSSPSAPSYTQFSPGQDPLQKKFMSTSCLDRFRLPILEEDDKEEV